MRGPQFLHTLASTCSCLSWVGAMWWGSGVWSSTSWFLLGFGTLGTSPASPYSRLPIPRPSMRPFGFRYLHLHIVPPSVHCGTEPTVHSSTTPSQRPLSAFPLVPLPSSPHTLPVITSRFKFLRPNPYLKVCLRGTWAKTHCRKGPSEELTLKLSRSDGRRLKSFQQSGRLSWSWGWHSPPGGWSWVPETKATGRWRSRSNACALVCGTGCWAESTSRCGLGVLKAACLLVGGAVSSPS